LTLERGASSVSFRRKKYKFQKRVTVPPPRLYGGADSGYGPRIRRHEARQRELLAQCVYRVCWLKNPIKSGWGQDLFNPELGNQASGRRRLKGEALGVWGLAFGFEVMTFRAAALQFGIAAFYFWVIKFRSNILGFLITSLVRV